MDASDPPSGSSTASSTAKSPLVEVGEPVMETVSSEVIEGEDGVEAEPKPGPTPPSGRRWVYTYEELVRIGQESAVEPTETELQRLKEMEVLRGLPPSPLESSTGPGDSPVATTASLPLATGSGSSSGGGGGVGSSPPPFHLLRTGSLTATTTSSSSSLQQPSTPTPVTPVTPPASLSRNMFSSSPQLRPTPPVASSAPPAWSISGSASGGGGGSSGFAELPNRAGEAFAARRAQSEDPREKMIKQIKGCLNKITPEKYERLAAQIVSYFEAQTSNA
eukprot:RCo022369